jgi:uncharacterized protein (DUF1499 family)
MLQSSRVRKMRPAPRWALALLLAAGLVAATACGRSGTAPGLLPSGELTECPSSPNCVSSQSLSESHWIEPLPMLGDPETAIDRLARVIEAMPRAKLIRREGPYLAAEFRTRLVRYVDDVEFVEDRENGLIHVRSASRVGHSDFGVNRKRVETIREAWIGANPPIE